jgi:hypothetical protein
MSDLSGNLDHSSKSSIGILCDRCALVTLREPNRAEAQRRVQELDFRLEGPPLWTCTRCSQPFRDWTMTDGGGEVHPPEPFHGTLCPEDYLRLLEEEGRNTTGMEPDFEPWRTRQRQWLEDKDMPAPYATLRLPCRLETVGPEVRHELLWCEAQRHLGDLRFLVRLHNSSVAEGRLRKGTYFLAEWDGRTVHGLNGRPIFLPVRRLRPDEARRYRRPAKGKRS